MGLRCEAVLLRAAKTTGHDGCQSVSVYLNSLEGSLVL